VQWLIISATQESEIRRIAFGDHLGQNVNEIPAQPIKNWEWWHTPVIPGIYKQEHHGADLLGQKWETLSQK
jgi:hypothetical protein